MKSLKQAIPPPYLQPEACMCRKDDHLPHCPYACVRGCNLHLKERRGADVNWRRHCLRCFGEESSRGAAYHTTVDGKRMCCKCYKVRRAR